MKKRELILDNINSPDDIKKLDKKQLKVLCEEIRDLMINTVSETGGHLASNLGVVELTVALHRVFDSPKDQIVWDVGHQIYTHKIITGRREGFEKLQLRKEDGISGFSRPCESEHDIFYSGHSSTSVSSAYGLLCSKQLAGDDGYVISVIGDGALSGGLAYEGMNNAGRSKGNLIVVLNDNKMSISKNVGSMARYLARNRSTRSYLWLKSRTERIIKHIPLVGNRLCSFLLRCKKAIKNMIYQSNLFEDLGFIYLGPIDGNDLDAVTEALRTAKEITKRPVLLHINTVKGKGYSYAEENPRQFHGISKFDVETGDPIHTKRSFSDVFGDYMCEFAAHDHRICAITAAMAGGTGLSEFKQRYKSRFFDVGIAEGHAVTFASGLAKNGLIPVFAVYSTFLQRSFDQLIHDGAMQRLKMVIAVDRAGFVGEDGESHNGLYDVSYLSCIPDITILSPADYRELKRDMRMAIYEYKGLVAVRFPRGLQCELPSENIEDRGSYSLYGSETADITIVTYGRLFGDAVKAADGLKSRGVELNVVKLNRIKPFVSEAAELVVNNKYVFFFEEGIRSGGAGEAFALELIERGYRGVYKLTAVPDCFVAQAGVDSLMKKYKLDAEGMTEVITGGTKQKKA